MNYVRLEADPYELPPSTAQAARVAADAWLVERGGSRGHGYVFTYTDANGLPAEVYG